MAVAKGMNYTDWLCLSHMLYYLSPGDKVSLT